MCKDNINWKISQGQLPKNNIDIVRSIWSAICLRRIYSVFIALLQEKISLVFINNYTRNSAHHDIIVSMPASIQLYVFT